MNDEDSDDDRFSMAAVGDIFADALKPYAEEDQRIFDTSSPKWVADVERMLASRNEKEAAATFRRFLDADGGMQKMRETLVRFSSRHKIKWSRQKDLQLLQDELRAVFTMISGIRQRAVLPLMEHSAFSVATAEQDGEAPFGPSVYAAIHYAVLETEQSLESMQDFTSMVMRMVGPDRGGRSSPVAKEFPAPLDWLARSLAYDWQDAGRNFRKHDAVIYLHILRAINEVITDDEDLPRGGKDLLAHARKVTRSLKPKQ
jgi:hypothetical protein